MRNEFNVFQKYKQNLSGVTEEREGGETYAKEKENACKIQNPAHHQERLVSLSCHLETVSGSEMQSQPVWTIHTEWMFPYRRSKSAM